MLVNYFFKFTSDLTELFVLCNFKIQKYIKKTLILLRLHTIILFCKMYLFVNLIPYQIFTKEYFRIIKIFYIIFRTLDIIVNFSYVAFGKFFIHELKFIIEPTQKLLT